MGGILHVPVQHKLRRRIVIRYRRRYRRPTFHGFPIPRISGRLDRSSCLWRFQHPFVPWASSPWVLPVSGVAHRIPFVCVAPTGLSPCCDSVPVGLRPRLPYVTPLGFAFVLRTMGIRWRSSASRTTDHGFSSSVPRTGGHARSDLYCLGSHGRWHSVRRTVVRYAVIMSAG